jgi:hypothetical protein
MIMPRGLPVAFARRLACLLIPLLAWAAPSLAGPTDISAWFGGDLGRVSPSVSYGNEFHPSEKVLGSSAEVGYTQYELRAMTPLWQSSTQELALTGNARYEDMDSNAKLPSGKSLPAELWDLGMSLSYRRALDNGWMLGGALRLGSASDKPFHSDSENTYGGTAFVRMPSGDHGAWVFLANFDLHREVMPGVPVIPGVGYLYTPSKKVRLLVGAPFSSLSLRPVEDLDLSVSYAMVRTLKARATYRLTQPLSVYTGFEMFHQAYYLADRDHSENQLFLYQKRALGGVTYALGHGLVLDLSGGWSFDRFFFQGENYGDRDQDRLDLENGAYFAGSLGYRF